MISFYEPVWIKRGYVILELFCVGNLWVGTHITINGQFPDGIRHFQTLFWNRERQNLLRNVFSNKAIMLCWTIKTLLYIKGIV